MDVFTQFHADLTANSPDWVKYWLAGLIGVLSGSILFALFRVEGRAILLGVLMGMAMTVLIYAVRLHPHPRCWAYFVLDADFVLHAVLAGHRERGEDLV